MTMIDYPSTPPPAVARRRTGLLVATAAVLALLACVALTLSGQTSAHADTGFNSIVCGGQKQVFSGDGAWFTNGTGGIDTGEGGCQPGIDVIAPTADATSVYDFGQADGGWHRYQAWIPTVYATADVDFRLDVFTWQNTKSNACPGIIASIRMNEYPVSGWQDLFARSGYAGCHIEVVAESSHDGSGSWVGLDAIRSRNT